MESRKAMQSEMNRMAKNFQTCVSSEDVLCAQLDHSDSHGLSQDHGGDIGYQQLIKFGGDHLGPLRGKSKGKTQDNPKT